MKNGVGLQDQCLRQTTDLKRNVWQYRKFPDRLKFFHQTYLLKIIHLQPLLNWVSNYIIYYMIKDYEI